MSDAGRQPGSADWPPLVPSGIHLRPRTAVAPSVMPELGAPAPAPALRWAQMPAEAGRVTAAQPEPPPATAPEPPPATGSLSPRTLKPPPTTDAPAWDGPLLDPAGYRLRLIRDAAAALALLAGVVLIGSLLAWPAPTGDVLSATGARGDGADPRGAPGLLLPDADDAGGDPARTEPGPAGSGDAPSASSAASSGPATSPSPTAGTSVRAEPVP
jgi:hypothetical protein